MHPDITIRRELTMYLWGKRQDIRAPAEDGGLVDSGQRSVLLRVPAGQRDTHNPVLRRQGGHRVDALGAVLGMPRAERGRHQN